MNNSTGCDSNPMGCVFPLSPRLVFLGDPNIEVSNKGQTLKIKSARLGDQARYQCSVTNAAGKQTKDFNLSVYGGCGSKPVRKCVRVSQFAVTKVN